MEQAGSEPIRRFRWAQLGIDAGTVVAAYLAALYIRFSWNVPPEFLSNFRWSIPVLLVLFLVANHLVGLYTYRFPSSWAEVKRAIQVGLMVTLLAGVVSVFSMNEGVRPLPLSVVALGGLVSTAGFALSRDLAKRLRPESV